MVPPRPACFGRIVLGLLPLFCGTALFAAGTPRQTSGDVTFFDRLLQKDITVFTVTDVTPEGRKQPVASKENPIYYEALILGYNDWGRPRAGEILPDKKTFLRLIVRTLAQQGYRPADAAHPATIILALAWGSMNERTGMSLLFMGGDKLDLLWEMNPNAAGGMLDARVLLRGFRSGEAQTILESSSGNLYVASIQAFDRAAALRDQTVALWHTKISCPADGLAMDSALRQMVRTAGPMIGRETERPIMAMAPLKSPKVEIGELKVLEMIDTDKLPVTDRTLDDKGRREPVQAAPAPVPATPAARGDSG